MMSQDSSEFGLPKKRNETKKDRMKPKMSKAEMQLAIIKKKQCDAKALAIVEQLLEPDIEETWLLKNLNFINKSHMEDVIEERAIIKRCGYVLCKNSLTRLISQTYHISTRKNKVYDVRKRKNFCSSICFGASNYLFGQMSPNPLWSREEKDIQTFTLLPLDNSIALPGDEIQFNDLVDVPGESKPPDTIVPRVENKVENSNELRINDSVNITNKYKVKTITPDTIVTRVENKVKEWITHDTLCLLSRKEDLENSIAKVIQRDKYSELCKKLTRIQLEEDKNRLELKPLPNLSDLLEEGKKLELKVHGFYKGQMFIDPKEKPVEETNSILPLTESQAPKALRRKILLDKLHKILPDLLKILGTGTGCSSSWYDFNSDRKILLKGLINTFALSPSNIVYKTTEWTLIGLILIQMLSILDPGLTSLLTNKQTSIHVSMILTSYGLGPDHLDKLMIEITNTLPQNAGFGDAMDTPGRGDDGQSITTGTVAN